MLAARGVAALLELATAQTGLSERLLRQPSGERTLTDLRHIGQELHAAMTTGRLGVSALVDWLREQIARAKLEIRTESTRRLETDAEAVQILTLHRSKGLEFPVVYLPEAWDSYSPGADGGEVLRLHEDGACVLDVGGSTGPGPIGTAGSGSPRRRRRRVTSAVRRPDPGAVLGDHVVGRVGAEHDRVGAAPDALSHDPGG